MNNTKNMNFQELIELEDCFSDILFLEKDHKYLFSDIPPKMSVSGLLKKYEKPFD